MLASAKLAKGKQKAYEDVIQQFESAAAELEKQEVCEAAEEMIAAFRERQCEANDALDRTLASRTEKFSSATAASKIVCKTNQPSSGVH